MNLLKHLIIQIESTEDVTDAYVESMQKTDPHFTAEENVFKVKLLSECYGRLEQREMIWRESEFIHNLGKGYFMQILLERYAYSEIVGTFILI